MGTMKEVLIRSIFLMAIFVIGFNGRGHAAKELNLKNDQQMLTAGEIKRFGTEFLLERLPWEEDQMDLRVEYEGENLVFPKGELEMDFQAHGRTWRPGVIPLILNIKVDQAFQRRLRLNAVVEVLYDVVKSRVPLRRGQILTIGDVELNRVKSAHRMNGVATRIEDAVGSKLRRNLKQDAVISLNMLERPPLVKKGDRVLIVAQKGLLKITAPGIVREKGFEDSMVKVENIQSKKIIYAKVVSSSMVLVEF